MKLSASADLLRLFSSPLSALRSPLDARRSTLVSLVPPRALSAIGAALFRVGYWLYCTRIGQWLHNWGARRRRQAHGEKLHSTCVVPQRLSTCEVVTVPMLEDNYCYVVIDFASRTAALVDASVPDAALAVCAARGVAVVMQLVTHFHWDHAGGVRSVLAMPEHKGARVIAPAGEGVPCASTLVRHGDRIHLGSTTLEAVSTPCHTPHHICYAVLPCASSSGRDDGGAAATVGTEAAEALFTGDALFLSGVGGFFHGDARSCHAYLTARLGGLPDGCKIFCAHEYTLMNARFARWLEDDAGNAGSSDGDGSSDVKVSNGGGSDLERGKDVETSGVGGAAMPQENGHSGMNCDACMDSRALPVRRFKRCGPGAKVVLPAGASPVAQRLSWVLRRRALGLTTMPALLGTERQVQSLRVRLSIARLLHLLVISSISLQV